MANNVTLSDRFNINSQLEHLQVSACTCALESGVLMPKLALWLAPLSFPEAWLCRQNMWARGTRT